MRMIPNPFFANIFYLKMGGKGHCEQFFEQCQEGSRSSIIIFDLANLRVQVGRMDWVPLRVLKAEVAFDKLTISVDKDFLNEIRGCSLPGMQEYQSDQSDPEDNPEQQEEQQEENNDDFAAMGMIIPVNFGPSHENPEESDGEGYQKFEDEVMRQFIAKLDEGKMKTGFEPEFEDEEGMEIVCPECDEIPHTVELHLDESGELAVFVPDMEAKTSLDTIFMYLFLLYDFVKFSNRRYCIHISSKQSVKGIILPSSAVHPCQVVKKAQPEGRQLQYLHSPAWQALEKEGLLELPDVKGCGLCYNRHLSCSFRTCFATLYIAGNDFQQSNFKFFLGISSI